ncbi:MAG: formylglycine-generating enzyme family protein [candidate division WOR-3 bacterium]|nr:formylglycine-generating enzyme family protein [candidate division WOR-3 bacterium]
MGILFGVVGFLRWDRDTGYAFGGAWMVPVGLLGISIGVALIIWQWRRDHGKRPGWVVFLAILLGIGIAAGVAVAARLKHGLPAPAGTKALGKNAQGYEEYLWLKDSSVMVKIPAGTFTMGSLKGQPDEMPMHLVYLDEYYMDKYEVTNRQYKRFCDVTGKSYPDDPGFDHGFDTMSNYFTSYHSYPVVNVSWEDAKAYCDWAGKRLPTEAEWEKAARGTDAREYPWGNSWKDAGDRYRANYEPGGYSEDGYSRTSPVGSFQSGASPYGCMDMAGNVWEWCNDWYGGDYYGRSPSSNPRGLSSGSFRVLRGGSWDGDGTFLRCAGRAGIALSDRSDQFGFRCAVTSPDAVARQQAAPAASESEGQRPRAATEPGAVRSDVHPPLDPDDLRNPNVKKDMTVETTKGVLEFEVHDDDGYYLTGNGRLAIVAFLENVQAGRFDGRPLFKGRRELRAAFYGNGNETMFSTTAIAGFFCDPGDVAPACIYRGGETLELYADGFFLPTASVQYGCPEMAASNEATRARNSWIIGRLATSDTVRSVYLTLASPGISEQTQPLGADDGSRRDSGGLLPHAETHGNPGGEQRGSKYRETRRYQIGAWGEAGDLEVCVSPEIILDSLVYQNRSPDYYLIARSMTLRNWGQSRLNLEELRTGPCHLCLASGQVPNTPPQPEFFRHGIMEMLARHGIGMKGIDPGRNAVLATGSSVQLAVVYSLGGSAVRDEEVDFKFPAIEVLPDGDAADCGGTTYFIGGRVTQ